MLVAAVGRLKRDSDRSASWMGEVEWGRNQACFTYANCSSRWRRTARCVYAYRVPLGTGSGVRSAVRKWLFTAVADSSELCHLPGMVMIRSSRPDDGGRVVQIW